MQCTDPCNRKGFTCKNYEELQEIKSDDERYELYLKCYQELLDKYGSEAWMADFGLHLYFDRHIKHKRGELC